ncbi:interleukin-27 subunit alpha [Paroedura picta]|uniref:interleukin-27 subunit alpha n=1 Tax=Paroedura picta TaxID=143630 RepID=UPI004056572F
MRLCGAAFFLQTRSSFFFLASSLLLLPQLEGIPQWQEKLQKEFTISLKVSRQLLGKTRILARNYLSARLPGAQLTLVSHSEMLPSVSLNFSSWISLSNAERLSHMAQTLSFYRGLLQQLQDYEATKEDSTFTARFEDLSLTLRDLRHHVDYQVSLWGLPRKDDLKDARKPPQILQQQSQWRNRLEIDYVLRSLKNLLSRVVRDFTLLRIRVVQSVPTTPEARSPSPDSSHAGTQ